MADIDYTPHQPQPTLAVASDKPDNYLVWAILATICCCLPTGIAAIVFAAQVDSKWAGGDYAGAQESSEKAKLWSWISLGAGIVFGVLYVLLILMTDGAAYA